MTEKVLGHIPEGSSGNARHHTKWDASTDIKLRCRWLLWLDIEDFVTLVSTVPNVELTDFIMHMYTYLSTICLVCCITAATPVEPRAANSRFSIQQSVPKPSKRSGPAALISSYVKFNKKPPAEVRAAAAQSDGTVSALPEELDVEYLSPVSIGGQILNLNVDTGSADLCVVYPVMLVSCRSDPGNRTVGSSRPVSALPINMVTRFTIHQNHRRHVVSRVKRGKSDMVTGVALQGMYILIQSSWVPQKQPIKRLRQLI